MKYIFIMLFLFPLSILAADLKWNCFNQYNYVLEGEGINHTVYYDGSDIAGAIVPSVGILSKLNGTKVELTGSTRTSPTTFLGIWTQMEYGSIINYESFVNSPSCFCETYGSNIDIHLNQESIKVQRDKSIYLAVMADSTLLFPEDPIDYYYGWVELYISREGDIELKSSAMSIDGTPLFVGGGAAIPEPTSKFLIILGLISLALKRNESLEV